MVRLFFSLFLAVGCAGNGQDGGLLDTGSNVSNPRAVVFGLPQQLDSASFVGMVELVEEQACAEGCLREGVRLGMIERETWVGGLNGATWLLAPQAGVLERYRAYTSPGPVLALLVANVQAPDASNAAAPLCDIAPTSSYAGLHNTSYPLWIVDPDGTHISSAGCVVNPAFNAAQQVQDCTDTVAKARQEAQESRSRVAERGQVLISGWCEP